MNIFWAAAARRALAMMQQDRATIGRTRADAATNSMVTETVYEGVPCHLSARKGLGARRMAALDQTEAQAQTAMGYTVFFAPGITVKPGDFIVVTHDSQTVRGHAGLAEYGGLGVSVSLEEVVIA